MMRILGKDLFLTTFSSIKIWRLNCDIIASLWHYYYYIFMLYHKILEVFIAN